MFEETGIAFGALFNRQDRTLGSGVGHPVLSPSAVGKCPFANGEEVISESHTSPASSNCSWAMLWGGNELFYLKLPGLGGKRKEHGLCFGGR